MDRRSIGLCLTALGAVALCCGALCSADTPPASALAEPPPPPQVESREDESALERRVGAFVRAITRNPGAAEGEPPIRWNTPICVRILGLPPDNSRTVSEQLTQIASAAGAPLAKAPCQPNFIIVATSEPDRVLEAWYARDKSLFGEATATQIRQFLDSSKLKPVRVWYNIDTGRKSGTRNGHFIPSNLHAESSVFAQNAVFDFFSVFAIIDTERTAHTPLLPLADYVAMAGLTNLDLDADLGNAPSILGLFAPAEEKLPPGLSRWDAAFLKALYESDQASRARRLDIEERVIHDVSRSR
jgi:hypothetical protein